MIKSATHRMTPASRQEQQRRKTAAAGFTLVELLVSVGLVLLMMVMFTEIFRIASDSITTQRGLSENDQRARMLTTLIQSDLNKRTFQDVTPLDPAELTAVPPPKQSDFVNRRGYLMISENDPNNDTDDLIQFTTDAGITAKLLDTTPYYGKATELGTGISINPNQPEADDAQITADGTSQSPYAEICYFMRGGNLYRRTLLIRKPLDLETTNSTQPQTAGGADFFDPTNLAPNKYNGNFWNDFDFSAYRPYGGSYVRFHDLGSLNNYDYSSFFLISQPNNRFGHNHATGLSREFVDDTASVPQFIGRFTHQETSDPNFMYPQAASTAGGSNPMNPSGSLLELDRSTNVVSQYADGSRRAEDLVLSNVVSFDVKLFDEAAAGGIGQFVDIGGADAVDYATSANTNYRNDHPDGTFATNIFDTWSLNYDIDDADSDGNFTTGADDPPFRPVYGSGAPKSLKSIQIIIRYIDVTSQQVRQMTIVHPLRVLIAD